MIKIYFYSICLLNLFLFTSSPLFGQQYYITTSGSSSNDGLSEATAKNIEFIQTLTAGDIVYVKAGNYGEKNLVVDDNGTSSSRIQIIGYKNVPGDITPSASLRGSTFDTSYPYGVNATEGPTLVDSRTNNVGTGIGIEIQGDYVSISNFQFKYFEVGLKVQGGTMENVNPVVGVKVSNVLSVEAGNHNTSIPNGDFNGYSGRGFLSINATDFEYSYITVSDAGAENISFRYSRNGTIRNFFVITGGNSHNDTDYPVLLGNGNQNNQFYDFKIETPNSDNKSEHGFTLKPINSSTNPNNSALFEKSPFTQYHCFNNDVYNFEMIGARIELQSPETYDNIFRDGTISAIPGFFSITNNGTRNDYFRKSGALLTNASKDNEFRNIEFTNCGVTTYGTDEIVYNGSAEETGTRRADFDNCSFIMTQSDHQLLEFGNAPGGHPLAWPSNDVYFWNCTFYNFKYFAVPRRATNNWNFTNCIIDGIPTPTNQFFNGVKYPTDFNFETTNFSGSFSPTSEGSTANNISTYSPLYANEGAFDLRLQAGSPLEGLGIVTPYRAAGSSLGAYQDTQSNNTFICNNPNPPSGIAPTEILVSQHDGNVPCNLMDNDLNTRWSAEGDGEWAQFDLGSSMQFNQVQIAFYVGDQRISTFDIQISDDTTTWVNILTGVQSGGSSLSLEDFNFPMQTARYIRYLGHGNSQGNLWNSITELRINKTIVDVESISLTPESATLEVGETENIIFSILPANATDQTVTWSSSDNNIAAVDASGIVTAIAAGNSTITATTNDGGFIDTSSISVTPSCLDDLPNEDTSISLSQWSTLSWNGSKTIEGISNNTNGSDCALKVQKNETGDDWARFQKTIDLASNNLSAGDKILFSLDANGDNGNPRFIVATNVPGDPYLINHPYPQNQGWTSHSEEITIPSGTSQLRIWLYPNVGSSNTGYSLFDNLIAQKIQGTSLVVNTTGIENHEQPPIETARLSRNPSISQTSILLPEKSLYTEFQLYSINGSLIKKGNIHPNQIELPILTADIEKGVYIIRLSSIVGNNEYLKLVKE
ncbi:MAG: Ig-like domain-containing protein [Maribacter sp.]|uniref:Ig-like domain-containing protein n=1 Tax=Maribacter sp. TaxID=1897614 RepID=UPI0032992C46